MVYSATLNQTNVANNNNKFYIIQVLQSDSNPNSLFFFTRWGRVGARGQNSLKGPYPLNYIVSLFNKKKHEKNKKGDYRELDMNYGDDEEEDKKSDQDPEENNEEKAKKK